MRNVPLLLAACWLAVEKGKPRGSKPRTPLPLPSPYPSPPSTLLPRPRSEAMKVCGRASLLLVFQVRRTRGSERVNPHSERSVHFAERARPARAAAQSLKGLGGGSVMIDKPGR